MTPLNANQGLTIFIRGAQKARTVRDPAPCRKLNKEVKAHSVKKKKPYAPGLPEKTKKEPKHGKGDN